MKFLPFSKLRTGIKRENCKNNFLSTLHDESRYNLIWGLPSLSPPPGVISRPPSIRTLCISRVLRTVFDLLVISFAFAFGCSDWELQWLATYSSLCTVDFDLEKKRPNLGKIPEAMSLSMTVTTSQTKTPEQTRKTNYVQCCTISLYFTEINTQQHSLGLQPTYLSWKLQEPHPGEG